MGTPALVAVGVRAGAGHRNPAWATPVSHGDALPPGSRAGHRCARQAGAPPRGYRVRGARRSAGRLWRGSLSSLSKMAAAGGGAAGSGRAE